MSGIAMLSSLRKKTCATYKGNHKRFSSSWTLSASLSLEKPPPALQLSIVWVQHSNSNIYWFGSNIVASWVTLTTTDTITPSPLVSSATGNTGSAALSLSFCNAAKWEEFTVTWKHRYISCYDGGKGKGLCTEPFVNALFLRWVCGHAQQPFCWAAMRRLWPLQECSGGFGKSPVCHTSRWQGKV